MQIKFISYDGEYPNLCSGKLLLEIDGKTVQFGGIPWSTTKEYREWKETGKVDGIECYYSFWSSGGSAGVTSDGDDFVYRGKWQLEIDDLPDHLKPHAQELIDIFNANVSDGCCGGCI